jgi:hypothetical protein
MLFFIKSIFIHELQNKQFSFDTLFNLKLNYSQSKQIFGNCSFSSCHVFDKTKAPFPPNYTIITLIVVFGVDLLISVPFLL